MNPYNAVREMMVSEGLQRYFELVKYMPPAEYPRLLKEEELRPEQFREAVLDVVMEATAIQHAAQEGDDELLLFDDAMEQAAEKMLNAVQLSGLKEALEDGGAPLSPELIAAYKLSQETVLHPARLSFACKNEVYGPPDGGLSVEVRTILFPEAFDIIATESDTDGDLAVRAISILTVMVDVLRFLETST